MHLNDHEILNHLLGRADEELFRLADGEKRRVYGAEVFLRGVIEFSNVCNKSCHYCGLRAGSRGIARYRLEPGEILQAADEAVRFGAGTVVLQSGDDFSYSPECIGELIRSIKARHCVAVTLSLGDRDLDEYAYWRECGADRCLLKLETTSDILYKRLRNGEDFRSRLHRLEGLRALGFEVGTGVITGLPGADLLDLLRDIRFLAELDPDMIAVGPFVPHPGTPLASGKPGSVDISNRATALLRLLVPHANIPATSALDALQPGG
ncbi:MAG: radical SAM protein, partial [Desulfovibrionaceae bacterium]